MPRCRRSNAQCPQSRGGRGPRPGGPGEGARRRGPRPGGPGEGARRRGPRPGGQAGGGCAPEGPRPRKAPGGVHAKDHDGAAGRARFPHACGSLKAPPASAQVGSRGQNAEAGGCQSRASAGGRGGGHPAPHRCAAGRGGARRGQPDWPRRGRAHPASAAGRGQRGRICACRIGHPRARCGPWPPAGSACAARRPPPAALRQGAAPGRAPGCACPDRANYIHKYRHSGSPPR